MKPTKTNLLHKVILTNLRKETKIFLLFPIKVVQGSSSLTTFALLCALETVRLTKKLLAIRTSTAEGTMRQLTESPHISIET
jgi:hypothetical protein